MSEQAVLIDLDDAVPAVKDALASFPWLHRQPRVLVVDDDEDTRATLAMILARAGIPTLEAGDAYSALLLAESEAVSAVILDVMLPDSSGFEVCRLLRENPLTSGLRVIMLSALSGITDEVSGVLSGADAYLVKPVREADLLRRLTQR